ncbi:MAG: S41 family peptidase [Marinilabiliaceae bacterium]|jgi:carboxyl-terminal processing protease|nr:S41 family peptidase [Marinilabiliaceae bacterium]
MKKIRIIRIVLLTLVIATATVSLGFLKTESNDFKLAKNLDIYFSLFRELNTFYVDGIDPDKLVQTSIDEMLKILDPYTVYYSEDDQGDFRFMTTGKYGGIGSLIRKTGDYVTLTQIYKGFPADKAGLKAGDKLKSIDGFSLKGLNADEVSDKLKGDPNTDISLVIEREGSDITRTLKRERIAVPPVPFSGMLDDEVGYIRFTNFTQNCSQDVRKALLTLKEEHGAKKIILDLRNNPGGLLTEAVEIVNLFVDAGQEVLSTRGKVDKFDVTYKTTRKPVDVEIPLVVMINRNSASASEIVAGAIQDLDRGIIVGQRSYGKGLVQISRPLSYNASLKVTTAKYYIPSGRCVQALDFTHRNEDGSVGMIPDSLISEFKTRNGRTVKDGGGIIPDYTVEIGQLSQVAAELYLRSYIFDYGTSYFWRNTSIDEPGVYSFPDSAYEDFRNFLKDRNFSYETGTEDAMDRLLDAAKREKYYESNRELFDNLKLQLEHKLENDLISFKNEIIQLLEDDIVGRYYYEEGSIKHNIKDDKQIEKAIEVLKNKAIYSSTLKGEAGSISINPLSSVTVKTNNFNESDISC